MCKGLRSINAIVASNPQWFMLEISDGFGAHILLLPAMKERFYDKILSLKEEGDSSHINKTYDKYAAPFEKVSKVESLAML